MAEEFTPRSFAEIRDQILADEQAEYRALGVDLSVVLGSHAYLRASALSLQIEAIEQFAAQLRREIMPDTASTDYLNRHGDVDAVSREQATKARFVVAGTGTPSTTADFTGRTLRSTSGLQYNPDTTTAAIDGSGNYSVAVTAAESGSDSDLPVSSVLTWDSLPTNVTSLNVTISSVTVEADDDETDTNYARRIMDRRRERPGSGNRSDWQDWTTTVTGVDDAFVYPLLDATLGANTPGAVTVLPIGPDQGTSVTNTRVVSGGTVTNVQGFIEGTKDADGNDLTQGGVQLRPASLPQPNYSIEAALVAAQNIDLQIINASAYAFPFTARHALVSSTATTTVIVGDFSSYNGKAILVFVGTANARGGYLARTVTSAVFGGVNTTLTYATTTVALSNDAAGFAVYPQPPNWANIQTALFALFDALGPGDVSPAARFPSADVRGPFVLYPAALIAAVMAVAGVLAVTVVTPGAAVTPAAKTIVTLGQMTVRWT